MTNPTAKKAPMNAITLTQPQLQAIGAILKNTDIDRPTRYVRFRRASMVVTNGHLMLCVPLPPAERDFAVDGVLLAEWTAGLNPKTQLQLELVGSTVKLTALRASGIQRELGHALLPVAPSTAGVVHDAAIDSVLTQFKEGALIARFALSHRYLDMAREIVEAFTAGSQDQTALVLLNADSPSDPIRFRFATPDGGNADLIIMPMRQ